MARTILLLSLLIASASALAQQIPSGPIRLAPNGDLIITTSTTQVGAITISPGVRPVIPAGPITVEMAKMINTIPTGQVLSQVTVSTTNTYDLTTHTLTTDTTTIDGVTKLPNGCPFQRVQQSATYTSTETTTHFDTPAPVPSAPAPKPDGMGTGARASGGDGAIRASATQVSSNCPGCEKLHTSDHVEWAPSLESAQREAAKQHAVYAIYVCEDRAAPLAGEGFETRKAYKLEHAGVVPEPTIFDDPALVTGLTNAGVTIFVKIPKSMSQDIGAPANSLILRAPDGEKLDALLGWDCNPTAVPQMTADLSGKWKQWEQRSKLK